MKKIFRILAMVAIAGVTFVGCDKENGGEGVVEDNTVYAVYQKVDVQVSEELRNLATIEMTGADMTGETLLFGIQHADSDTQDVTTLISDVTTPLSVSWKSTIKEGYTAGEYTDLSFKATLYVELRNKEGQKIAGLSKEWSESKVNVTVNEESATVIGLLKGTEYTKSIEVVKGEDGSYSLQ